MNREILFSGKRIDNGDKLPNTYLTLLEPITQRRWKLQCVCGNETIQNACDIERGHVISCGCKRYKSLVERNTTHNGAKTRLYRIWRGLFKRCNNNNATDYKNYGGRGIKIATEWYNFEVFRDWAVNNGYSDELTIERINVNGNYESSNCCWITKRNQALNRRKRKSLPLRDLKTGKFIKSIQ